MDANLTLPPSSLMAASSAASSPKPHNPFADIDSNARVDDTNLIRLIAL